MTKVQIPSGLLDDNIELFSSSNTIMATHSGSVKHVLALPKEFLDLAIEKMQRNPSTMMALELSGYTTIEQQLLKYLSCQYGSFDLKADFKSGEFSDPEYHECGYRGDCPMEGVVCGFLKVEGKIITPFEIEIIKLLATEDIIPLIAEKLRISINNLEEKKKVIFQKFNVFSRARLVTVCFNREILKPMLYVPETA